MTYFHVTSIVLNFSKIFAFIYEGKAQLCMSVKDEKKMKDDSLFFKKFSKVAPASTTMTVKTVTIIYDARIVYILFFVDGYQSENHLIRYYISSHWRFISVNQILVTCCFTTISIFSNILIHLIFEESGNSDTLAAELFFWILVPVVTRFTVAVSHLQEKNIIQ